MRYFEKQAEPEYFRRWKTQNSNSCWADFTRSELYTRLKKELMDEQDCMCCYCQIALKEIEKVHIEHIKPQSAFPQDIYIYNNLLASCKYSDSCGQAKKNGYFPEMVLPINATCQNSFTYTGSGDIVPIAEDDTFTKRTIELLGLNCRRLKDCRRTIIKMYGYNQNDLKDLEYVLEHCVDALNGFQSVIQYIIDKIQ